MSCRRVCAWPLQRPARLRQRARLPAQPRGQPAAEQQPGGQRVLAVAHGHAGDRPQLRPPARRVERRRDPLAPRRRAQPGEVDDVGVVGEVVGARQRRLDVRLVLRVDQHDLGEPAQRVDRLGMAVRRPHHRRQVADHQRVDDRVELGQVALADQQLDALAADRDRARLRRVVGADPRPSPSSLLPARTRPRTAPAATGGSGRRARAGSRSRRGSPRRRSRPCSSRAPGRTRAPPCGARRTSAAAPPRSRAGRRVVARARRRPWLQPPPAARRDQLVRRLRARPSPTRTCAAARRRPRARPSGSGR